MLRLFILFLLISLSLCSCYQNIQDKKLESEIQNFVNNIDSTSISILRLDTISKFKWDELLILPAYSHLESIENENKINLRNINGKFLHYDEYTAIVFINRKRCVSFIELIQNFEILDKKKYHVKKNEAQIRIKKKLFKPLIALNVTGEKDQKEVAYLLFDTSKTDKCVIGVESSYENPKGIEVVNKYRKWHGENHIEFLICDENFTVYDTKKIDTFPLNYLKGINFVDIDYLINKYDLGIDFKYHVFEKIYFIEKISSNSIVRYEVTWEDGYQLVK